MPYHLASTCASLGKSNSHGDWWGLHCYCDYTVLLYTFSLIAHHFFWLDNINVALLLISAKWKMSDQIDVQETKKIIDYKICCFCQGGSKRDKTLRKPHARKQDHRQWVFSTPPTPCHVSPSIICLGCWLFVLSPRKRSWGRWVVASSCTGHPLGCAPERGCPDHT